MRIRIAYFCFFLSVALTGKAQDVPGSVYSSFGFGNLYERSSSYTRAIGYTSIGVRNDQNVNVTNPAALTAIGAPATSLFEIGGSYGSTYSNNSTNSNTAKYGGLSGINLWFRFSKKWATAVGASPASSPSYSVLSPRVLGGTLPVQVVSQATGGLNQFYVGNAFEVFKNFNVGANFSYYLGTVKRSELVPSTSHNTGFEVEQQLTGSGANYDLGFQYTVEVKESKFTLGGIWNRGATLVGTNQVAIVNPITFDTLQKNDRHNLRSHMPTAYGAGVSLSRKRILAAFDFRYIKWDKASFDQPMDFQNVLRYSGGFEYKGDYTSFNYLKQISIRAGGWYQNFPVNVLGTKLNTWGYTLGIALPVQANRATVSLNYSFTQVGQAQYDLVREQSRRLSIDVIVRDVWGFKRPLD